MLVFDESDVLLHPFEWSALVDSVCQNADTKELKDFADWLTTTEQPQGSTLIFMIL